MSNNLYDILMFGGITRENYMYISNERHGYNRLCVTFLSLLSCMVFTFLLVFTSLTQLEVHGRRMYAICLVGSVAIMIVSVSKLNKNHIAIDISVMLYSLMLMGFSIYGSIVKTPNERSDIFLVVIFIIPLLFAIRPLFSLFIVSAGELIYLILLHLCCYGSPNFLPNLLNTIIFSVLGIILGVYFTAVKLRSIYNGKRGKQLLETDMLTGLFNRRSYETDLLKSECVYNLKAVVVFDINNLKKINDSKGHSAGDELIKGAAHCISTIFQRYGKCYRTGGDEFIALLYSDYGTEKELLQEFDSFMKSWKGESVDSLSISYGFLPVEQGHTTPITDIIQEADDLMYTHKRQHHMTNTVQAVPVN